MVCCNTQSALYKAVDRHNSGCSRHRCETDSCKENTRRENAEKSGADFARKSSDNHARSACRNRCEYCPKQGRGNFINDILSDKDMLLIAGLILVFMAQKADNKLIIALAVVLLG